MGRERVSKSKIDVQKSCDFKVELLSSGSPVHPGRGHAVPQKFPCYKSAHFFSEIPVIIVLLLLGSQLITAFTREVASSYLAETLSSEVESLIEGPSLELDPSKIVAKLDLGQQAQILGEKCHQVFPSQFAKMW